MKPVYDKSGVTIYHGYNIFALMSLPDNSVDSIVTDPPYGLKFMGNKWDYDIPSVALWAEALRVLKPGGHMLCFAGSRTYHRMAVNIENAGFEIRDQIMWIYGSGFPKSLDVSKALDEAAGAEREVVGSKLGQPGYSLSENKGNAVALTGSVDGSLRNAEKECEITKAATEFAKYWEGWGTALKPAHEPIVVARKPFDCRVIDNVLEHGTGCINIDACRIETNESLSYGSRELGDGVKYGKCKPTTEGQQNSLGRFPSNIILDPEAADMLDKVSGSTVSSRVKPCEYQGISGYSGGLGGDRPERGFDDAGGVSRFFYVAKANKADREEGLEGFPEKKAGIKNESGRGFSESDPYAEISRRNDHPTVKPTELMQYLLRLVTPTEGTALDMFMGSGSTGKAAVREKIKFIGMERESEYIPISIARINAPAQVNLF